MTKYCPKCGIDNDEKSTFCRNCGEKLSGLNTTGTNNNVQSINNKILISMIVVLLIIIAITGTYTFVSLNNDSDTIDNSVSTPLNASVNNVSTENTKTWHKIDSFDGVGDNVITLNSRGNQIRVVSSAMPLKNYADNFMYTTVSINGYTVGSSQLSWNSTNAVAIKSDTFEFTGSGTCYIYISAYELQYWNLEIYEYY